VPADLPQQLLLSQEGAVVIDIAVGGSLVVRVGSYADPLPAGADTARIAVGVADPELARALTAAMADAVAGAMSAVATETERADAAPVVRLRSRKAVARESGRLAGAIAVIPVTARNARHLVALVDGVRAAGAIGVQLVWDGAAPPRAEVERHVFAALEHARATPGDPPVVLATTDQPVTALHVVIAHRAASARRDDARGPGASSTGTPG
jgi:hypothetical protein